MKTRFLSLIVSLLMISVTWAENAPNNQPMSLLDIQHRWAQINYQLPENEREQAFISLIDSAKTLSNSQPDNAEYLAWLGIVESSTAGAIGGLKALSYVKEAKAVFEKVLEINPDVLSGTVYTSLGTLYHKVPGWPVSFGSDKTAKKMLIKAIEINPDGADSNFFYAEFLFDDGDYKLAKKHLLIAQQAPARPDRPLADSGRQQQISELLTKVEKKLS